MKCICETHPELTQRDDDLICPECQARYWDSGHGIAVDVDRLLVFVERDGQLMPYIPRRVA